MFKRMMVIAGIGLLLLGAGCSSKKAEMQISSGKDSFIERRTSPPPNPPENIPAPTPVQVGE
jgi:uncharacterized lipoprotein